MLEDAFLLSGSPPILRIGLLVNEKRYSPLRRFGYLVNETLSSPKRTDSYRGVMQNMELQLVDTNYIHKHWSLSIWKKCFIIYAFALIILTINWKDYLSEYEELLSVISQIILFSGIIIQLLNSFLYIKTGTLIIEQGIVSWSNEKGSLEINLQDVKGALIEEVQNNIWRLQFDTNELELKMDKQELNHLKAALKNYDIKLKETVLINRFGNWIKNKPNFA